MIEAARGLRFLLKAGQPILVSGKCSGQDLDRHFTIDFRIKGVIHLAHPARSNLRADFVATEFHPALSRQESCRAVLLHR